MSVDNSELEWIRHRAALEEIGHVGHQWTRPSVLYRPTLAPDGDQWCALLGSNIMEGVAGFGDTPDEAMRDFDKAWTSLRTPTARQKEQDAGA